jgi:hypothetical protein
MFNEFCFYLNFIGFSAVSEVLRKTVAVLLPTTEHKYSSDNLMHYQSWLETPIGIVAFRTEEGDLQWEW